MAVLGSEDPRPVRRRARFEEILAAAWDVANEQAELYAIAQEFFAFTVDNLTAAGVTTPADVDTFTAIIGGLANSQASNEPGGDRWTRHLPTVQGMYFRHITDKTAAGTPQATGNVQKPSPGRARRATAGTSNRRHPAARPSSGGGPS